MAQYDQSRTPELYGGTISLIMLATFLVVVRIVARNTSAANLWWDDFVIVVALVREIQKQVPKIHLPLTSDTTRFLIGASAHAIGLKLQPLIWVAIQPLLGDLLGQRN